VALLLCRHTGESSRFIGDQDVIVAIHHIFAFKFREYCMCQLDIKLGFVVFNPTRKRKGSIAKRFKAVDVDSPKRESLRPGINRNMG
jgi:hypothetical protein